MPFTPGATPPGPGRAHSAPSTSRTAATARKGLKAVGGAAAEDPGGVLQAELLHSSRLLTKLEKSTGDIVFTNWKT